MTYGNSPTRSTGGVGRATANIPLLYRLNIHRRLTLCFIFIIVLMLIGNGVLLWQLHLISAQVKRLNGVNEELIEVLRVHTGLLSAYERLGVAARSEDSGRLLKECETLRAGLVEDAQRTQAAFSHLPPEVKVDQTVLPTLESIERALPSHLDAIKALAASGAEVVAAASIIDRSGGKADVGVPRVSLAALDVPAVPPVDCEACQRGDQAIKPGSRKTEVGAAE